MRPNRLLLALSLAAVAAPAALSAHPSGPAAPHAPGSDKAPVRSAKGPKGTNYLLHACIAGAPTDVADTADTTDALVNLTVLGGNRHMRDALAKVPGFDPTAPEFDATLDGDTFVRLVGKARPAGVHGKKAGIGTVADLKVGDRVIVRFWAKRDSDLAGVPAWRVIDRGHRDVCDAPATTPPADQPADPGTTQPGL